jgi:uncharacterized protein (DUF885 family)
MFKGIMTALVLFSITCANSAEIDRLAQEYIDYRAAFYPIWATGVGIHDYDSLLTDYSSEAIFQYRNELAILRQDLGDIDTSALGSDEYIDYKLLMSNLDRDEFFLNKYPLHARSAALYVEDITDGLYLLLIDKSRSMEEKAPFLLARIRQIGDFLNQRWDYQYDFAPIFYETAIDMLDGAVSLINETGKILLEAMPDSSRQIARYTRNAARDLQSYKLYCSIEKGDTRGSNIIGKDALNFLLKHIYFLDVNSDSLKTIGWTWYEIANAKMDSLEKVIAGRNEPETKITYRQDLTKQDIIDYYQWEINQEEKFVKDSNLVSIPDDIGACIPVEMPAFMRAIRKGIAYMPPPPFSSDQTGYFYVRPIEDLDSLAKLKYSAIIQNRGFRGSAVHEAYPGHHLQFSIANNNPDPLHKIQVNLMMAEGWALYCEQMATEHGLFPKDELAERWHGVYGGIRFRAVRVIVDCSLADGSMTPDSALAFMNSMLGENTDYFTAEIRRYSEYPTQALSYLTGKLMIMQMLKKARAMEGNSFSLKAFHDKILAEGTIPPTLIAEKLGYK